MGRDSYDRVLTDEELDIQADAGSNVPEIGSGGSITDDESGKLPPIKKKKKRKSKGPKKNPIKIPNGLAARMNGM